MHPLDKDVFPLPGQFGVRLSLPLRYGWGGYPRI